MELTKNELNKISGGRVFGVRGYIIGGVLTFIIGLLDGFLRPLRCN